MVTDLNGGVFTRKKRIRDPVSTVLLQLALVISYGQRILLPLKSPSTHGQTSAIVEVSRVIIDSAIRYLPFCVPIQ